MTLLQKMLITFGVLGLFLTSPEANETMGNHNSSRTELLILTSTRITNNNIHGYDSYYNLHELTTSSPARFISNVIPTMEKDILQGANKHQLKLMSPAMVFVCILLAIGIPGNLIAIWMYLFKLKKSVAREFVLTLAISDLVTCVFVMPSEIDIMTRFFDFDMDVYCKLFRFIAYFTNNVSSCTLIAIAVERYRVICKPWKQKLTPKISRYICYINIILSALYALPLVFIYGTLTTPIGQLSDSTTGHENRINIRNTSNVTTYPNSVNGDIVYGKTCTISDQMLKSNIPFYVFVTYISSTVIVYIVLTLLYGKIGRSLYTRRRDSVCQQNQKRTLGRARRVTVMGFTLTIVYQICYLPCFILIIINITHPQFYTVLSDGKKMIYLFLMKSYLINCAINPIIYCLFNKTARTNICQKCNSYRRTSDTAEIDLRHSTLSN